MSQGNLEVINLELEERRSQHSHSHTIDRLTSRGPSESSASHDSHPQKDKEDIRGEAPYSVSFPPLKTVNYLHAQDNFPDGGLHAWLVVLGVRFLDIDLRAVMN
jgi:hypothetical protein